MGIVWGFEHYPVDKVLPSGLEFNGDISLMHEEYLRVTFVSDLHFQTTLW